MTQIDYNNSFNKGLHEYENLYRLETTGTWDDSNYHSHVFRPMADILAEVSQVDGVSLSNMVSSTIIYKGETKLLKPYCTLLTHSLENLNPTLLSGTLDVQTGNQLVIPRSLAEDYFGTVDAVGQSITFEGNTKREVIGVYEDFPDNCLFSNAIYSNFGDENLGSYWNWNYRCIVRLTPGADVESVTDMVKKKWFEHLAPGDNASKEEMDRYDERTRRLGLRFNPVSETYFSGVDAIDDRGNRGLNTVMEISCILIIIVAAINFINFTLAETPMRIKSINTRKILGSSTFSLRASLLLESCMTVLVAFLLATGVVAVLNVMPEFNNIIVGTAHISTHISLWLFTLAIALTVGIVSGLYPSYYVTSFQPAMVIKGSFGLSPTGQFLRKGLMGIQMIAAFIMVVYIGIIYLQRNYIFSSDYGYDKDEVLFTTNVENTDALRTELLNVPGISNISFCLMPIGIQDMHMQWGRGEGDKYTNLEVFPVDWRFIDTYGIKIIEGRNFNEHDGDVYIVNKAARDKYSWIEMDKPLTDGDLNVVGVCENVRFSSTRVDNNNTPMAFVIFGERHKNWTMPLSTLNIRVEKNVDKTDMIKRVKEILDKACHGSHINPINFFDEELQHTYEEEMRFISQIEIFSIISVIITLVGVFCLTMFETEYRRKEIGIRKVMGSSIAEVLALICRQYVPMILISFVIAAPVAYYMGDKWLQNFAEHTAISWWLFPLTLAIVFVVVMLTVIAQSYRAASENPVNSIKTE